MIVAHVVTAYVVDLVGWYYEQRTTSQLATTILSFPILLGGIFGLGPLFVLAGWLSARTLARRGAGSFVRSRLVRLGIPLVFFTLLIDPVADYLGKFRTQPWWSPTDYLTDRTGTRDMGPLWFVAALLVFSLVYAAWRTLRPAPDPALSPHPRRQAHHPRHHPRPAASRPAGGGRRRRRGVVRGVAGVAPRDGDAVERELAALAAVGDDVHARRARSGARLARGAAVAAGAAAGSGRGGRRPGHRGARGRHDRSRDVDVMTGGPHWQAATLAVLDGVVAVCWVWWLLALFRRRWNTQRPWAVRASRGSYAAFLIHPVVLVLLSLAVHAAPWPAEAKFVLVATAGGLAEGGFPRQTRGWRLRSGWAPASRAPSDGL